MKVFVKVNGKLRTYAVARSCHIVAIAMVEHAINNDNHEPCITRGACLALAVDNTKTEKVAA